MIENRPGIIEIVDMKDREYYCDLYKDIDEAYELYMPQIRYEIEEFYIFLNNHYGLTPRSKPFNILEIGTKFGGTFYLWCTMNKSSGLNISIDMDDGGKHGGIGTEKMDERDEWFKDRFNNCYFIRGDSHSLTTKTKLMKHFDPTITKPFDELFPEGILDFLFIDGDHTYDGVRKDWEMYSPFVSRSGIIAFHDITISDYHHKRDVYVGEFWENLTKNIALFRVKSIKVRICQ